MVSRIVHQNIHGSVFRGVSVHQLLRLLRVRNIEPVIMYPVAEFFQGFRYFFRFTAGCNTYNSPCTDQASGNSKSKSGSASGYNSDLTLQVIPVGNIKLFLARSSTALCISR